MAYIGKSIESGTFSVLDTSGNTYNGSNVTFNLGTQVGSVAQLLVSHDGVIQKPGTDYTLATGGTQITFTTAPASGASIFIVEISGAVGGPLDSDLNGTELILDADGDTSITADTDDQIDFKIAGADDLRMTANAINVLSGTTLTVDSGATITNSGTANGFGTDPDGAQVFNESGADVDFRVESNGNANMLFISGGNDVVGIGAEGDLGSGVHIKVSDTSGDVSANADNLVIEENGNVGLTLLSANNGTGHIFFGNGGDQDEGFITYDSDNNRMRFGVNGAERVRFQASGNVSIGNTGDNQKLFVYGSHYSENGLVKIQTSNGSGANDLIFFEDGNNHDCGEIYLDASANTVAYNTSSDYRLKENAVSISDGIDRVKQLKPYRFNWISKPDQTVDGFFAHEVQGIVDEAITGEKDAMKTANNVVVNADGTVERHDVTKEDWEQGKIDGVYANNSTWKATKQVIKRQSIDQSKLVPLLVASLQEAITKIESLEARVTTLEG